VDVITYPKGKTMKDKYTLSAQELENINSELFNSFDPEQELWIIGGSTSTFKSTTSSTFSNGNYDMCECDYMLEW
jgi:hypothetical protein